jgi:hypothetical protein
MSPNTIGFVDREGASAWLNEPAAFGAVIRKEHLVTDKE